MTTTKKLTAAPGCSVYRRISDADDRSGVDRQTDETAALAAARGWAIDPALDFEDNDLSASAKAKKARPGFERLLQAIAEGKVQRVIATEWERIERSRKDCARFMEVAVPAGVHVALVRGADMDLATPAGRLVADVLSSIARHEVEQKDARAASARAQRLANGKRAGGQRPFGYTLAMEPVPAERTAVRECYRRLLRGESLGSITRWLNASGHLTPRGREWIPGNLGQALRKGCYVGLLEFKGEVVGEAAWKPIVDRIEWERAQALLVDPTRRTHTTTESALLTAVALCGVCADGTTVHGGGHGNGGGVYRCSRIAHMSQRRDPVNEFVLAEVADLLRIARELEAGWLPEVAEAPSAAPELVAEAEELEARRATLAGDLGISEAALAVRLAAIETRLHEVRQEIADAGNAPASVTTVLRRYFPGLKDPDRAPDEFLAADRVTQRNVIRAIVDVTVYPLGRGAREFDTDRVTVRLKKHLVNAAA